MSIKETFEVIKDAVNERISSPILGSFAFFVFGFNWQTLVTVWKTQLPIEVALQNLETTRITWTRGIFWPAGCTIIFCLAYPWLKFLLSWYSDWVDTKRILKRQNSELLVVKNRKELLLAQTELEQLKSEKIRESERLEKKREEERLASMSPYERERSEKRRIDQEMELEEYKLQKQAEVDQRVRARRKDYGLED